MKEQHWDMGILGELADALREDGLETPWIEASRLLQSTEAALGLVDMFGGDVVIGRDKGVWNASFVFDDSSFCTASDGELAVAICRAWLQGRRTEAVAS